MGFPYNPPNNTRHRRHSRGHRYSEVVKSWDLVNDVEGDKTVIAAQDISALRLIRSTDSGACRHADHISDESVFGLAITAAISGENVSYICDGEKHSDSSWNWEMGKVIFLGVDGALTQDAPNTGYAQQVAIPIAKDGLQVSIKQRIAQI